MATGDFVVFEEAKAYMIDGGWEAADVMKCAILDNSQTPVAATATPNLSDFTEVGTGGTYPAGGFTLDDLGTSVTEAAGVMKYDSSLNPTFAADVGNDTDAFWGLVYNSSQSNIALGFVDLGGPVDMQAGSLTITWNASGLFTIT